MTEEEVDYSGELSREEQFLKPLQTYKFLQRAEKALKENNKQEKEIYHLYSMEPQNKNSEKLWQIATIEAYKEYLFSLPENERGACSIVQHLKPIIGFIIFEYDKKKNTNLKVDDVINFFIKYFIQSWKSLFPKLKCPTFDSFLILTNSNEDKEIFQIHGPFDYAFTDLYHLKSFLTYIYEEIQKDKKEDQILVQGKQKHKIPCFDLNFFHHNCSVKSYQYTKPKEFNPMVVSKLNQMKLPMKDEDIFDLTVVNLLPKNCEVISFPKLELLSKVCPKLYLDIKQRINLLKPFKTCNTFQDSTHFELYDDKMSNFCIVDKKEEFDQQLKLNISKKFYVQEKFTQKTKFVIQLENDFSIRENYEYYIGLYQKVVSKILKSKGKCYIFKIGDGCRIIWPKHIIDKDHGSKLTKEVMNELSKEIKKINFEKLIDDVYAQGFVSVLGAQNETGCQSIVTFHSSYDENGKKSKNEITNIYEIINVSSMRL